MYDEMYGLDGNIASFAIENGFTTTMNKGCYQLGCNLKPFCFFPNDMQDKYGVIDLTAFSGLVDAEQTLVNEVAAYRRQLYTSLVPVGFIPFTAITNKVLFLDYLLSVSICYLEVPKEYMQNGERHIKYDKYFATRNPRLMSAWTGDPDCEMQAKYSGRLSLTSFDFANGEIKLVKLAQSAKGTTISCPRNSISVNNLICVPLFMQYAFLAGALPYMGSKLLRFSYLKDNGVVRELTSTLSREILMDYYHDETYVDMAVSQSSQFNIEAGGMMLSEKQSRGYIRVPEVGASRYDKSGVRAVNIARLLNIQEVASADRTFIDVDLDSVYYNFTQYLDFITVKMASELPIIARNLGIDPSQLGSSATQAPAVIAEGIRQSVETRAILLSTEFIRTLHLFMLNNPQWFPAYTGKKNEPVGGGTASRTPTLNLNLNSINNSTGVNTTPVEIAPTVGQSAINQASPRVPSVEELLNIGDIGVNQGIKPN